MPYLFPSKSSLYAFISFLKVILFTSSFILLTNAIGNILGEVPEINIASNLSISSDFISTSSNSIPISLAISIILSLVIPFKTASAFAVISFPSLIANILDLLPSVINPFLSTNIASKVFDFFISSVTFALKLSFTIFAFGFSLSP